VKIIEGHHHYVKPSYKAGIAIGKYTPLTNDPEYTLLTEQGEIDGTFPEFDMQLKNGTIVSQNPR
jgi:hypothetical protein